MTTQSSTDVALLLAAAATLVVISLAPLAIADDDTLGRTVDVVFMIGSLIGLTAIIRAVRRSSGRDRLAWSLIVGSGVVAVLADVVAPTRGVSTIGLAMASLVAGVTWFATIVMRSASWTRLTVGRAAVDGLWIAVASLPLWWRALIEPFLDDDALDRGPTIALLVLSAIAIVVAGDLLASLPRVHGSARVVFVVLGIGGLVYVVAGQLLARAEITGISPDRSGAAAVLAAIPVVAVVAGARPELSRLVGAARDIEVGAFWAITLGPLVLAAPVLVTATTISSAWAVAAVGVLALRAGLVVRENRDLLDAIADQSRRDPLTGLANRRLLDRLDFAGRPVGVCYVDLDDFKPINDELGHQAGDEVLRIVARRLSGVVREHDVVIRLGGDEFALLMETGDPGDVERAAERSRTALRSPIVIDGRALELSASIGTAHARSCSERDDLESLIDAADGAMYEVKRGRTSTAGITPPIATGRGTARS